MVSPWPVFGRKQVYYGEWRLPKRHRDKPSIAEAQAVRVSGYLSEFLGSFGFWTTVWATSEK